MKRYIWIVCVLLCSIMAASAVGAEDFDGTRPLLVSVIRAVECVPDGSCREVPLASVELPQFLKIDFSKKTIRSADDDDKTRLDHGHYSGNRPGGADGLRRSGGFCRFRRQPTILNFKTKEA